MKTKKKQNARSSLAVCQRYFPNVREVVDATTPIVVEITSHDQSHSTVMNHTDCALAVACTRATHADGCIIGLTTSFVIKGKVATRYRNTEGISREITSFDREAGFDVGYYQLSPPYQKAPHSGPSGRKNPDAANKYRHYTKHVRTTLR